MSRDGSFAHSYADCGWAAGKSLGDMFVLGFSAALLQSAFEWHTFLSRLVSQGVLSHNRSTTEAYCTSAAYLVVGKQYGNVVCFDPAEDFI